MSFSQWLADMRWAMNMKRARAWRRKLTFTERQAFDDALRPLVRQERSMRVDYPDAFYRVTIDDLCRAMMAAGTWAQNSSTSPKQEV